VVRFQSHVNKNIRTKKCKFRSFLFSLVTFQEQTGTNVLLLPIGASDDGAHSQNEKFDISNYMNGMKLMGVYFQELANL
jgi:acetylornithine deacetylase/succinyl-diaminopimelate desuccinylase-like protein